MVAMPAKKTTGSLAVLAGPAHRPKAAAVQSRSVDRQRRAAWQERGAAKIFHSVGSFSIRAVTTDE